MKKLHLKTAAILQGDFSFEEINLLVVFQVNCPGCFIHALPLANELHNRFQGQGFKMLGLSTAFEDFEFNNMEHTQNLLRDRILVGETKKEMERLNVKRLSYVIEFPVAMDLSGPGNSLYQPADIEQICRNNQDFSTLSPVKQNRIRQMVQQYLLAMEITSYTFTANQMEGTPSWILFHKNGAVLEEWFGHRNKEEVLGLLGKYLPALES
jgi:hypothetical protein